MKPSNWILIAMAVGCLVFAAGCKKQEKPSEWKTLGVRVSLTELRQAFKDAPGDEIQAWLSDAEVALRQGQYTMTLATLDKLANRPGLTAQQKKVTSEVISQVKQLAANRQALPGR